MAGASTGAVAGTAAPALSGPPAVSSRTVTRVGSCPGSGKVTRWRPRRPAATAPNAASGVVRRASTSSPPVSPAAAAQ